jgi:hypothetical protein
MSVVGVSLLESGESEYMLLRVSVYAGQTVCLSECTFV